MNKKGFYPLYTTLGLIVILMVVGTALNWNNKELREYDSHIDRLAWLKLNNVVSNVRYMVSSVFEDLLYQSALEIGKMPENNTLNPFLEYSSCDSGWENIKDTLSSSVASDFSEAVRPLADYSSDYQHIFTFDGGINITIGNLLADDIGIVEENGRLVAVVRLPMYSSNRYNDWESTVADQNITIPIRMNIKDIYYRACEFHQNYETTVQWTLTMALYARVYYAAYSSKDLGPFLKKGHYDFDPIGTVLFGDLGEIESYSEALRDNTLGTLGDIGAIPAATWFTETQYLSEPSFFPAGFDISSGEEEKQIKEALSSNYDMEETAKKLCNDDSCRITHDTDYIQKNLDDIAESKAKYSAILSSVEEWSNAIEDNYEGLGCDDFRRKVKEIIGEIIQELDKLKPEECSATPDKAREEADIDGLGGEYGDVKEEILNGDNGLETTKDDCGAVPEAKEKLQALSEFLTSDHIDDGKCKPSSKGACIDDETCEDPDCSKTDCDVPTCNSAPLVYLGSTVGAHGYLYECRADDNVGSETYTCEECETVDGEEECENLQDTIDLCECQCHPSEEYYNYIDKEMDKIENTLRSALDALGETERGLAKQKQAITKSQEFSEEISNLDMDAGGYDVFSRIDPVYVKYSIGTEDRCYMDHSFDMREKGICGDSLESGGLYAAQIAAASFATLISSGIGNKLLEWAIRYFPLIYESSISYRLTETIVDDENRIMLKDLTENGGMYTYTPFEFEIYKDHEFTIGSASFGRVVVYLNIYTRPKNLLGILNALTDCEGEECKEE